MGYVKWLGHAAFEIELDGKLIYVDPWLTGNPKAAIRIDDVTRADLVLVTHDHADHLGDAVTILRKTGAKFVGVYELGLYITEQGIPEERVLTANIGGVVEVEGLKIILTPAHHSATRGSPCGYIIVGREATIYHAGDTGLLHDIKLYADLYPITIALLPIGSVYTMDPLEAAYLTGLIKPRVVIPMHYGTFPAIEQDPEKFRELVRKYSPETQVIVLRPGEVYRF